ncbi:MAG: carbohydrate-binding family 9-like protein [Planctomycetota bacterium]
MQIVSKLECFVQSIYCEVCVGILVLGLFAGVSGCALTGRRGADGKYPVDPELKELADRAETAMEKVGSTTGREYANRLRGKQMQEWLKYFRGERDKPGRPGKGKAVEEITRLVDRIEDADTWPAPGHHQVPFTREAPEVDGELDDAAWDDALTFTDSYPFDSTDEGGPETTYKVLWDKEYMYFAFDCEDEDVVAEDRDRDGQVASDDCVKLFILPTLRYPVYWELVVGASGSIADALNTKNVRKWGCDEDAEKDIEGLEIAQEIRGTLNDSDDTDEGYSVEIAVPFSDIPGFTRYPPRPGDKVNCMLIRRDKNGEKLTAYAFRPLQAWGHNLWNYAVFELSR